MRKSMLLLLMVTVLSGVLTLSRAQEPPARTTSVPLPADFLEGTWLEVAGPGCGCRQTRFAARGDGLAVNSLCLTDHGPEIEKRGFLTFTNSLRTQFEFNGEYQILVETDLKKKSWVIFVSREGKATVLINNNNARNNLEQLLISKNILIKQFENSAIMCFENAKNILIRRRILEEIEVNFYKIAHRYTTTDQFERDFYFYH